jgi:single-stranded-DNA-specific exonuclease
MSASLAERKAYSAVQTAHRRIRLRKQNPKEATAIVEEFKLHPVSARILAARGYSVDDMLKHYLTPTLKEGLPAPVKLKNLTEACVLIGQIIDAGGGIAICCDFDVDGLSGGAQVHHFLTSIGVRSEVFVPDRFEDGYGLNEKMIRTIADQKFALLIAIDYGTTNLKELSFARKLGLKTIVIDHHHVGTLKPTADVFINPNQRGCGFAQKVLCASGLAWYLLLGLKQHLKIAAEVDVKSYLDLACLGTICDMVPLIGPNRIIAKRGLELLAQTERPGLVALKNVAGVKKEVSCSDVGFGIGPRLNAAGRLVHGDMVIELLTTTKSGRAGKIAQRLNRLNLQRQETEARVKEGALEQVRNRGSLPAGIVVWDKDYHTGVVGIVAQRLVEQFYRPAVVLGADSAGVYKGSVRGIKGFNVVECLGAVGEHLIKFGGHEGAGGLSVLEEKLADFEEAFVQACEERLTSLDVHPYADADTEATLPEIDTNLVVEFQRFAPFGMGNPNPQILVKKLKVTELKVLKETHLKATLTDGKRFISGLMWRQTSHPALKVGATVNVVCRPDVSTYMGRTEIQCNLQAVEAD